MKYKQKFETLLGSQEFDQLKAWEDPDSWKEMQAEEKELLALLFTKHGEQLLKDGSRDAFDSFKRAAKLAPKNIQFLYQQAIAFANQTENSLCLRSALKLLKKIVKLDPGFFDAWHLWAQVLLTLGMVSNDPEYLQESHLKFLKAEGLYSNASSNKLPHMYRHWGICWYHIGKLSGEAVEYQNSIEKYIQAVNFGLETPELWNDYANAVMELGILIGNKQHCLDAIEMYQIATRKDTDYYAAWLNLASGHELMFTITGDSEHFFEAYRAFTEAVKLNAELPPLWILWGRLLASYGRQMNDLDKLSESIEKFEVADMLDHDNPITLAYWGEAYLQYGAMSDHLELLHQAENKIAKSLELQRDNPQTWCLYGMYWIELGRYYDDSKYFKVALEKFQKGLKIDPQSPELHYGMAVAYFSIGNEQQDADLIQKSAHCCHQALECGGTTNPKFWNDYGLCYFRLAEITNEKHYLESALDRFEQAVILDAQNRSEDQINPEYLHNLGCALDFLGDFEADPKCYEQAIQILLKAAKYDPEFSQIHYHIGLAYTHYAELTSDENSLHNAIEHFQIRNAADYEDDHTLSEWGIALIHLAHFPNQNPNACYEEAEKKLIQALALGNTQSHYHLACLYSLTGNYQASIHQLMKASKTEDLPPIDELLEDEWLEGVRKTSRFKQYLAQIKKEQK